MTRRTESPAVLLYPTMTSTISDMFPKKVLEAAKRQKDVKFLPVSYYDLVEFGTKMFLTGRVWPY